MFDLTSLLATFVVWEAKRKRFDSPLGFVLVIKNANSDFAYGLCDFFAYGLRDFCVRALRLFCVRASRKFSPKPSSVNYNCLRNAWILVLQFDLHSWAHSSMQPKWRPVYWWLVYSWPFSVRNGADTQSPKGFRYALQNWHSTTNWTVCRTGEAAEW